MTLKKTNNIDFENSIKELTSIVNEMEKGDLTLENALKNFEKGIKIIRECHNAIEKAEQKVQILVKEEGEDSLESYQQQKE